MNLLPLFANNILPIFLSSATGYLLSKRRTLNAETISTIIFYILSPCLVFDIITHSEIIGDTVIRLIIYTLAVLLGSALLAYLIGRAFRLSRKLRIAIVLCVLLPNSGNYGLSLNLFAFGEQALTFASVFFVTAMALTYTVGVLIASMGQSTPLEALKGLLKVPTIYATTLGIVFMWQGWQLPAALERPVLLLSDAALPLMLVLLGIQLEQAQLQTRLKPLLVAIGSRMLVSPTLGLLLASVLQIQGAAWQAGISEAAMPAAVTNIILATKYDVEPAFVTTVVFVSTLLSPLTLTPLLAFLGA